MSRSKIRPRGDSKYALEIAFAAAIVRQRLALGKTRNSSKSDFGKELLQSA
jgi:hypothetical protein